MENKESMKAYIAYDSKSIECYHTIVFAENARKAKMCALYTDCCDGADYIDIRVKRQPAADKLYKGKWEIDWYDMETRIELVKNLGWSCGETSYECDTCKCKPFCNWFENEQECGTK